MVYQALTGGIARTGQSIGQHPVIGKRVVEFKEYKTRVNGLKRTKTTETGIQIRTWELALGGAIAVIFYAIGSGKVRYGNGNGWKQFTFVDEITEGLGLKLPF